MAEATTTPHNADQTLLQQVITFLTGEGWPAERTGEQPLVRTRFQGQHGQWPCYAHCRTEFEHGVNQCLFYSVAPLRAPEVLRPAVAEFVTRANWGLLLGNFEMDYTDGEVRFKTSIQLNSTPLTAELLHPLIYGNVAVMDKYLPGLQAVVSLAKTPQEAIHAVEASEARQAEAD